MPSYSTLGEPEPEKKSNKCCIGSIIGAVILLLVGGACFLFPLLFVHPMYYNETVVKGSKPDTATWDLLMTKYVTEGALEDINLNVVDYEGLSKDEGFNTYLKSLATADLSSMDRKEFYATYMNAYNAFAMNMVIQHPCKKLFGFCIGKIDSIRDVSVVPFLPVWKTKAGILGGAEISLDAVESALRAPETVISTDNKEDPRLHACIVCASISCPNIRASAFTVENVDTEMDEQITDMLANDKKGFSLNKDTNTITLSKIFSWYGKDFTTVYDTDIVSALFKWMPVDAQTYINAKGPTSFTVEFFDYNWNANGDVSKLL